MGFILEDPEILGSELEKRALCLTGGVVFWPFYDPKEWEDVLDGSLSTCKALKAHGVEFNVITDSISLIHVPTAGRGQDGKLMELKEWSSFLKRI